MANRWEQFPEEHPAYKAANEDLEIKNEEELRIAKKAAKIGQSHQPDLSINTEAELKEAKEMAGVETHEDVVKRLKNIEDKDAVTKMVERILELKKHILEQDIKERDRVIIYCKNGEVEENNVVDLYRSNSRFLVLKEDESDKVVIKLEDIADIEKVRHSI